MIVEQPTPPAQLRAPRPETCFRSTRTNKQTPSTHRARSLRLALRTTRAAPPALACDGRARPRVDAAPLEVAPRPGNRLRRGGPVRRMAGHLWLRRLSIWR